MKPNTSVRLAVAGAVLLLSVPTAIADTMWHYTVRPGDNLITLGKKHLINPDDWKVLQRINGVTNPYGMPVGKVLRMPLALVKQEAAGAEVVFVSGTAQWQQSANNWVPLAMGQKLGPGANITTQENSKVVIRFADGSTTDIASNSRLRLDSLSLYSGGAMVDTKLRLQQGQIETHANPKHVDGNQMQVVTPSAIAAVRGTKFRVSADKQATIEETLDGKVALGASNQQVDVNKGFGSKAELGKKPIPPVVLLPAVNTSSLNTKYESLPLTVQMPEMDGAAAWVAKVSTDAAFNQVVAEGEFASHQIAFADVPDGQLYLNLRAKDAQGIVGYEAVHPFELNARPAQPALVSPAGDALIRDAKPTLQWQTVGDAQAYVVEVAKDATFTQLVASQQVSGVDVKLDKPLTEGQYHWRVTSLAKAESGALEKGPALQSSQFNFRPAPAKPDISQLNVSIARNRVFVETIPPLDGLAYQASLDNPFNQQKDVWQGRDLGHQFDFLLKEYGQQVLYIRHLDSDGTLSEPAAYAFDAQPE